MLLAKKKSPTFSMESCREYDINSSLGKSTTTTTRNCNGKCKPRNSLGKRERMLYTGQVLPRCQPADPLQFRTMKRGSVRRDPAFAYSHISALVLTSAHRSIFLKPNSD